jgi:hypothetical protein
MYNEFREIGTIDFGEIKICADRRRKKLTAS